MVADTVLLLVAGLRRRSGAQGGRPAIRNHSSEEPGETACPAAPGNSCWKGSPSSMDGTGRSPGSDGNKEILIRGGTGQPHRHHPRPRAPPARLSGKAGLDP